MSAQQAADEAQAPVTVRAATREDLPEIHRMITELATYEGEPNGCELTVQDLEEDGFAASPPWFFALVAAAGARLVGYALCNRAYSSWTRRALYIEDLYVRPESRRAGVGELLVREVCRIGVEAGVHRVDWHVLESNAPALAFYARIGARDMRVSEGRAAMRLDREHIERLALSTAEHR